MSILVEVCAGCLEDCFIAKAAGADRIELNVGMDVGGLTPPMDLIEAALETEVSIVPMLRARGGDFVFADAEYTQMLSDAEKMLKTNIAGLVFGILTSDGHIDVERNKKLVEMCKQNGKIAIFHMAFDETADEFEALEDIIALGFTRILTSGRVKPAVKAAERIRGYVEKAAGRIEILAGGGVDKDNVVELIQKTGVTQVHLSTKPYMAETPLEKVTKTIGLIKTQF